MAGNKKFKRARTNLRISPLVKLPGIEFAEELGWSLSELVERLLEAQLIKHKRLKERLFPIELDDPPKEAVSPAVRKARRETALAK